ncbi:MAG: tail fiber domain-containing protein [Fluviicola sp.]|nr:tail fiber domain-containing protein [Fluviicola sp.]
MKQTILIFALLLMPFLSISQAPNLFKFQSVARDVSGATIQNSLLGLRISIRDLSSSGLIVFQETHVVTTNDFGLFSLSIGSGANVSGSINTVNWGVGSKFLEIEADLTGGTSYQPFGISQLLSVPYALHANSSNSSLPNGASVGNTTFWDGTEWVVNNNNIYNAGNFIGLGNNSPLQKLDVNGNINIPADSSYMIGNRRMFWANLNSLFIGDNSGNANTFGIDNTFFGNNSGLVNVSGSQNTFIGAETGSANLDGGAGTFIGNRAGLSNTIGLENTFIGAYAGQVNTIGSHNSFLGVTTGALNTEGNENTFLGAHAGYSNTTGSFNTYVGNFSGVASLIGNGNTALGFEADFSSGNLTNSMALGYQTLVSASNTVVVGNTNIISIGGQVGWSTLSDRRLKKNITDNQLGLEFIKRLNTVNYEYVAEGQRNIRYTGLIAQDVEKILVDLDAEFSGVVAPTNDKSYYSIRYSEFVVPLIKSVQEQSIEIDALNSKIKELEKKIDAILQQENSSE